MMGRGSPQCFTRHERIASLCIVTDGNTETLYRAAGSSLDLFLKHPQDSVSNVDWKFNDTTFAEYITDHNVSPVSPRFSGRLKVDQDKVGVTVHDLQLQDSGKYEVMSDGPGGQLDTQVFNVYIQNPITNVKIEKNQTWLVSTNSCMISVSCEALGAENVTYRWSGYKGADGAQLKFSFLPAEEEVTLNCTAANNVSNSSATERLTCTGAEPDDLLLVYIGIGAAAAGGILCVVLLIVTLICRRNSGKGEKNDESTVYADVNDIAGKDGRRISVANGMTIYETVDDVKAAPATTIYARVTLPQDAKVRATTSSPYQQVQY
ncbi:T-lymphocyte surface antigen Ly-9 [Trichomycterus rosablanca]|uniref:T-lymphocyte surface antigen Ly-9 n=1 Tax=Trichomycterus rosablanca TaxID=2290929 RepID=UPI002F35207F